PAAGLRRATGLAPVAGAVRAPLAAAAQSPGAVRLRLPQRTVADPALGTARADHAPAPRGRPTLDDRARLPGHLAVTDAVPDRRARMGLPGRPPAAVGRDDPRGRALLDRGSPGGQ